MGLGSGGLWDRVLSLGFRDHDLVFEIYWFRVYDLGFEVKNFRV